MANYRLSQAAKSDLLRIYRWGLRQFGEAQADRYYQELFDVFERIAENPKRYPETDIREGYRMYTAIRDTVYYRIINGSVEIMAILGKQNSKDWL